MASARIVCPKCSADLFTAALAVVDQKLLCPLCGSAIPPPRSEKRSRPAAAPPGVLLAPRPRADAGSRRRPARKGGGGFFGKAVAGILVVAVLVGGALAAFHFLRLANPKGDSSGENSKIGPTIAEETKSRDADSPKENAAAAADGTSANGGQVVHTLPLDRGDTNLPPPLPPPRTDTGSSPVPGSSRQPKSEAALTSLPADEQQRVDDAIVRGMEYLKGIQSDSGCWRRDAAAPEGDYPVGYAALPALTLLECGVRPSDPVIQKAATFVRDNSPGITGEFGTYQIALAVLFLDRLGEARDRDLIRTLALRLVASQKSTGGWNYYLNNLNAREQEQLLTALKVLGPRSGSAQGKDAGNPPRSKEAASADAAFLVTLPEPVRKLPVLQFPALNKLVDPVQISLEGQETDNSNTQFAILALWAARRHDIPMNRTMFLMERRFRTSQNPDGTWSYKYQYGGNLDGTAPMTCAGLLGLAVGHGIAYDDRAAASDKKQPAQDDRIKAALKALGRSIGAATGTKDKHPLASLYFLWSLERVGVLFNLKTIGGKDWYRWGAEVLVTNQDGNGRWPQGGFLGNTPAVNTCLALLFLKRANLAKDLTPKLELIILDK